MAASIFSKIAEERAPMSLVTLIYSQASVGERATNTGGTDHVEPFSRSFGGLGAIDAKDRTRPKPLSAVWAFKTRTKATISSPPFGQSAECVG